jgi:hydrogenase maturation protease
MKETDILVLGVGNLLLADDGIGVHAIDQLRRNPPLGVTLMDVGTAVLCVLPFMERAKHVLVIDALHGGREPGTIYHLDLAETQPRNWRCSIHALGLREALQMLAPGVVPPPIKVIGVEPAILDYEMKLSAPVAAALPQVIALARQIVADWQIADLPRVETEREPKRMVSEPQPQREL